MMALTSACFLYSCQHRLHARAEEVSVSYCNTQRLDKPGCSLRGSRATAQQSPRCVGREAPQLSHRLPKALQGQKAAKRSFPAPNTSSWLSGSASEHLGQVTRAGPTRAGSAAEPPGLPSSLPAAAARTNKGKEEKKKRNSQSAADPLY